MTDLARTYAKVFTPKAAVMIGGPTQPMTDAELDTEYARMRLDSSDPPGPLPGIDSFSATCANVAQNFTLVILQADVSAPMDAPTQNELKASFEPWLSLVDSGRYEDAWKLSVLARLAPRTNEQFLTFLKQFKEHAGSMLSRHLLKMSFGRKPSGDTDTDYAVVTFQTHFEKGWGAESVNLMKSNGSWSVASYLSYPTKP